MKIYNVTSQIAFGVGLAGVGTAVTLLILQRKPSAPAATSAWLPSAPNTVAGLSYLQRF